MTRPLDIKKKESCVMLRFWLLTQNYSLDFMLLLNVHEVMFYLVYFIDLLIYLPPSITLFNYVCTMGAAGKI